jgi:hypothetical protein
VFKKKRATKFATLSVVFGSLVGLSLQLPTRSIAIVAAIVVAAVVVAVGRSLGALLLVLLGSP